MKLVGLFAISSSSALGKAALDGKDSWRMLNPIFSMAVHIVEDTGHRMNVIEYTSPKVLLVAKNQKKRQ